jgi:hypothetical protein
MLSVEDYVTGVRVLSRGAAANRSECAPEYAPRIVHSGAFWWSLATRSSAFRAVWDFGGRPRKWCTLLVIGRFAVQVRASALSNALIYKVKPH